MRTICEAVWATEPEDLSLLHFLFYVHSAGGIDRLVSTEGGRAGRALRRRLAAAVDPAGRAARASVCGWDAPVQPPASMARPASRPHARRAHACARAVPSSRCRRRWPPALRLRPAAARASRPAAAAHARRRGDQVPRRLRRAVLARATGSAARAAPTSARPRSSSTTRRRTARRASCSPSSRVASRASWAAGSPNAGATRSLDAAGAPVRRARPQARGVLRARLGRRGVDARLLRRLPRAGRLDLRSATRCARRSGRCTGPAAEYATSWSGYMDGAVRSGEAAADRGRRAAGLTPGARA